MSRNNDVNNVVLGDGGTDGKKARRKYTSVVKKS